MRISKAVANETSSGMVKSSLLPPRLWALLPPETRRQVAQHLGQLVQRLRLESARAEESHRAEHDVVDG